MAASIATIRAESSETTLSPRLSITSRGVPSPLITPSTTWRANLSVNSPPAIKAITSATWAAVIREVGATSFSLARRETSPSHHVRARVASAPSLTVSSTTSRSSAFTMDSISLAGTFHSSCNRLRRIEGFSGIRLRSSSIQSASGVTGTRSGSGK